MNIKKIRIKEKNIGIEILRIYLSILVVNAHCYKNINIKRLKYFFIISKFLRNDLHVPTFFIISFYFFQNNLFLRNLDKYKKRFQRLLIPYIFWPIIIWITNNIIHHFFKKVLIYSIEDLKKQLLTGARFNGVFWFQWDLIFETFFFIFLELLFHKYILIILINIGLASYFFQYSHYNYKIFSIFKSEKKYTFGRIAEIIPYSISGFFLSYFKFIDFLNKNKIKTINICLLVFFLIEKYNFIRNPKGFYYEGFKRLILSNCLFIMFSMVSNTYIKKNLIKTIIIFSKFTPGIYYLHIPIKIYFSYIFENIKKQQLSGSFSVYVISYLICFIGNIICRNTKFINLFQ